MARTKGARDKGQRKTTNRPAGTSRPAPSKPPAAEVLRPPPADRPEIGPSDFKAEIAAQSSELGQPTSLPPDAAPAIRPATAAPASFDPATLTLDGLAAAWQLPFYLIALALNKLRVIGPMEPILDVGQRRAPELAAPSYLIYQQLVTQYLGLHPDNVVHAAGAVTAMNGIGILPDLIEAVRESRRRAAAAAAVNSGPTPVPSGT